MISDERLREAARQAEKNLLASLPEPEDCEATFSPKFKRKMKKLVCRTDHPIRYWIQKAVACILLVILLGGSSVLALSTEARAAFVGWLKEIYDTHFTYHYYGGMQAFPEDVIYRPLWLPEGYRIISENIGKQIYIIYESEDGEPALFAYTRASESLTLQVDRDGNEISQSVFVRDNPADLYIDQDAGEANILIWTDENKGLIFYISAQLDSSEIIKMAESISAVKNID